jgi:hypothetical protein
MDTLGVWQYKTLVTNDLSESALLEQLNHESVEGWELVTIQALAGQAPQEEDTLPGYTSHDLTGDYLLVFKKLRR